MDRFNAGLLLNRFSSVEVEANFVFMQSIGNGGQKNTTENQCGEKIKTFAKSTCYWASYAPCFFSSLSLDMFVWLVQSNLYSNAINIPAVIASDWEWNCTQIDALLTKSDSTSHTQELWKINQPSGVDSLHMHQWNRREKISIKYCWMIFSIKCCSIFDCVHCLQYLNWCPFKWIRRYMCACGQWIVNGTWNQPQLLLIIENVYKLNAI